MTEKEKMLAGLIYDASDRSLEKERNECKRKCAAYNNSAYTDNPQIPIKSILGKAQRNVRIEPPFWCDYGYGITVGENFYMNHGGVMLDAGGITFGDNVFIGPMCGFHTSGHPLNAESRNAALEYAYPIKIGNNVWIGAGVQIMPGVTVGDNTVIGGGSVVTKDIPSGVVAVGNPCRVIRKIDENEKSIT